jgi:hypothetical protein
MTNLTELSNLVAAWSSVAGSLSTICIALAGWFLFWPRFVKQKRLENNNGNAWKTLDLLDIAEENINDLFWLYQEKKPDEEQYRIQKTTILSLKKLHTGLLILQSTTPKIQKQAKGLASVIRAQEARIISLQKNEKSAHSVSAEFLKDLGIGSFSPNVPDFIQFEELRMLIASVAGLSSEAQN